MTISGTLTLALVSRPLVLVVSWSLLKAVMTTSRSIQAMLYVIHICNLLTRYARLKITLFYLVMLHSDIVVEVFIVTAYIMRIIEDFLKFSQQIILEIKISP